MMKTYQNHAMTDAEARQALADACKQVETNLPLYTYQCQNHSSVNNIYPGCANDQWTCGFWPGEIWLAYEATSGYISQTNVKVNCMMDLTGQLT